VDDPATDWAISINSMSDVPNQIITITATVPGQILPTMDRTLSSDWERFTVLSRAKDSVDAYDKMVAVIASLSAHGPLVQGGMKYHCFLRVNTINFIGRDERLRPTFSVSFRTLRHAAAAGQ
jgi:hypothetical protein